MDKTQFFYIPDVLENWPWSRRINPHHEEVRKASSSWAMSLGAYSPKAQKAHEACNVELLASLAYPLESRERLRTACDMMNLFFTYDEHSDASSPEEVARQSAIIMDAFRNPYSPRPEGEWVGGEFVRQFWTLAIETGVTQGAQKRLIDTFQSYTNAVIQEAEGRNQGTTMDIESFIAFRRECSGTKPSFVVLEMDMELPEGVTNHPVIKRMTDIAADMVALDNDVVSYNVEQARGVAFANILTVIMQQHNTEIRGAIDWVVHRRANMEAEFLDLYKNLPSWDATIDPMVKRYVWGLGNWVRANEQWSFESERYLGKEGKRILHSRKVRIMLPERRTEIGPRFFGDDIVV